MISGLMIDIPRTELQSHFEAVAAFWQTQIERARNLQEIHQPSGLRAAAAATQVKMMMKAKDRAEAFGRNLGRDPGPCGNQDVFRFTPQQLKDIEWPLSNIELDKVDSDLDFAYLMGLVDQGENLPGGPGKLPGKGSSLIADISDLEAILKESGGTGGQGGWG